MKRNTSLTSVPGRFCPPHYRYPAEVFAGAPAVVADTLYVVGGVYGNPYALDAVLAMAELDDATVVFNGDFNWFNIDATSFVRINEAVLGHFAIRGNVETELAAGDSAAGCGCSYPEWVGDDEVERSNQIMNLLRERASAYPLLRERLAALPPYLVAEVNGTQIGVVHGDAESLSGWGFSQELLRNEPERARRMVESCKVDVVACSHTCLPVLEEVATPRGPVLIANNGAAGMPNFEYTQHGIATRIAARPSPGALYGAQIGAVHVEAIPIHYDHAGWITHFDRLWPASSPASVSYRKRLLAGPAYQASDAFRCGATHVAKGQA